MIQEVWRRIGWKPLLIAIGVGAYVDVLRLVQAYGDVHGTFSFLQETFYTISAPILVLFAAYAADLRVERGAKPFRTYLRSLLLAALLASLIRHVTRDILVACCSLPPGGSGLWFQWVRLLNGVADVLSTGGFFMLAFYNRRAASRTLEAVRAAELRRVRLEGGVIESRLEAARSEVDPQELFASLNNIRDLLITRSPDADTSLDELIQKLRNRNGRLPEGK